MRRLAAPRGVACSQSCDSPQPEDFRVPLRLTPRSDQNCTPRYDGAEGVEILRREMAAQAGAYRTDVYEGTMISGATPSRMVHLQQVIEQREFFMGECHAAAERLEEMPEPLEDQARWSLETYRANHGGRS